MREILPIIIMIVLNTFAFLAQVAVNEIAAEAGELPATVGAQSAYMQSFDSGSNYTLNTDYTGQLPSSNTGVLATIGAYVFPFQVLLTWVQSAPLFITEFLTAVPNFLNQFDMPQAITWALSFMWFSAAIIFLLLAIIK